MKPGFALSLSAEGVVLLHRAAGGWRNVGTVPLDSADLSADLAALGAKGQALEAGGTCKLIIPNDQIRYLSIETGISDLESRRRMARAALEGATPYPVDDLAFDLSEEGSKTHIAAVAQETLAEAEAFALDNGFTPASFVAAPGDLGFLGEPFFGPAPSLGNTLVEPDGIAVVDVGPAEVPAPPAPKTAAPEAPIEAASDVAEDPSTGGDLIPETETSLAGTSLTVPKATVAAEKTRDHADPVVDIQAEDEPEESGPIQGFSSRRRRAATRAQTTAKATENPASNGAEPASQPPSNAPASKVAAPSASKTVPVSNSHSKIRSDAPENASPPVDAGSAAAKVSVPPAPTGANAVNGNKPIAGPKKEADTTTAVARKPAAPSPRRAHPASAQPTSAAMSEAGAQASKSLTASVAKGKPRHLGVILTAVLLLVMAAVAAFALLSKGGLFFSSERPPQEHVEGSDLGESLSPPEPPLTQETGESDVAPVPGTSAQPATPTPLSEAETEAETEPVSIAPQVSAIPDHPDPGVVELSLQPQPDEGSAFEVKTELDASTGQPVLDTFEGPAAEERQRPEQETSTALSEAALYAATGIWQQVPQIAEAPALISLDEIYVASIDNSDLSQDAVALPAAPEVAHDPELDTQSSPAAVGGDFTLDSRGLVTATPEGTLNPDGVMVYLGRPAVVPPATPERGELATAAAEAEAENARLATLSRKRPKLRPSDLLERAERALLGGLSRAELASVRPRARPASLKTEEQENQPVSNLAIAASKSPRARPSNFANLVDRAQRRQTSAPTTATAAAAVAAPVTVTPSLPSSASVARQATVTNAINLRNINLIGVSGKPSDRQALIRLPSGRYRKVRVGDRIDGGTVVAIGNSQLQYQKRGTNTTLKLPGD